MAKNYLLKKSTYPFSHSRGHPVKNSRARGPKSELLSRPHERALLEEQAGVELHLGAAGSLKRGGARPSPVGSSGATAGSIKNGGAELIVTVVTDTDAL